MNTLKVAWLCWLLAAMLFFSCTKVAPLIMLLIAAGFGISAWSMARALLRSH